MQGCFCNSNNDNSAKLKESALLEVQGGLDLSHERNKKKMQAAPVATKDEVSKSIAEALGQLSLEERDEAYCEIHGVADQKEETPEQIALGMGEMHQELRNLKEKTAGLALRVAAHQDAAYAQDEDFMLHFLRSDDFSGRKAAGRYAAFFHFKLEFFGEQKLCKDILYEDLDVDDIALLKKGCFQLLPQLDRVGRNVSVVDVIESMKYNPRTVGRVLFYTFGLQTGYRDKTPKKKPVNLSIYSDAKFGHINLKVVSAFLWITNCLPTNSATFFLLVPDTASQFFQMFVPIVSTKVGPEIKARTRIILGSYTEWSYQLMSFGIPIGSLPWTDDGKLKTKQHLELIETKRAYEFEIFSNGNYGATMFPNPKDVLCGKGRPLWNHPGNQNLRVILEDHYLDRFVQTEKRNEKANLAAEVVEVVKGASVRFLSKETGVWLEVSDEMARRKVSDLFRSRARVARANKPSQDPTTSVAKVSNGTTASSLSSSPLDRSDQNPIKRLKLSDDC